MDQEIPLCGQVNDEISLSRLQIYEGLENNAEDESGIMCLHKAIEDNQVTLVDKLLAESTDLERKNKKGRTPLLAAVRCGNEVFVEKLIKKGADVNCVDEYNFTPLHEALYGKSETIVELLLKNGAKVNIKDGFDYETCLHLGVQTSSCSVVKLLLEHESDVNAINSRGKTALHYVVREGGPSNAEVVRMLLNAGADMNIPDISECTSWDYLMDGFSSIQATSYMLCAKMLDLAKVHINVSENDLALFLKKDMTLCHFEAECHKELDQIKAMKFGDISLYNVLSDFYNPFFASNSDMEKYVLSDTLKHDFPNYACLLERKFKDIMKRNILLDDLVLSVNINKGSNITHIVLPSEMSRMVLVYLEDSDLLSATKAFKC